MNKGAAYLKTQKLTSSIKASNGQAVSKTYRLKTTPVYEQSKVKQAQEIIKKNGVASSTKTLTEAVKQYRITTEPTVNQTKLNQALSYLTKQKMKAAAQKQAQPIMLNIRSKQVSSQRLHCVTKAWPFSKNGMKPLRIQQQRNQLTKSTLRSNLQGYQL
ncbi:hypothetical protein ACVNSY_17290 [Bacillus sp. OHL2]